MVISCTPTVALAIVSLKFLFPLHILRTMYQLYCGRSIDRDFTGPYEVVSMNHASEKIGITPTDADKIPVFLVQLFDLVAQLSVFAGQIHCVKT